MPMLTPEHAIEVANDETAPQADRFAAMAYLNTRKLFDRLMPKKAAPAANSTMPAPAAAAAKPKTKPEAEIIDTIDLRVGYKPSSGTHEQSGPWAFVTCFRDLDDGDSIKYKVNGRGAERATELAHLLPGDIIRLKVREYGTEEYQGVKSKTARSGGVVILHKAAPPAAKPPDTYDDFIQRPGQSAPHVPQYGADGWPEGADDVAF